MAQSEMERNLAKLRRDIPKIAQNAMDFSMTWAENEAKRSRVFNDVTGRLRNSITGGIASIVGEVIIGGVGAGKSDAVGGLAATQEYAPRIELGFVGMDKLGRNYNQMPRPFIWPAIRAVYTQEILQRAIKSLLQAWKP